jgi:hypothetical protein
MEGSTPDGEEMPAEGTEIERVIEAEPAQRMDLYDSAAAQLDAEKVEAWRPDQNDPPRIIGEILSIEPMVNVGGATCPIILTVNTKEVGLRRVWAWHTVLVREIIEARPQVGDVVGFSFGGRNKSSTGREYVSYKVAIARDSSGGPQEIDYDRLAIEAAPESERVDDEPRVETKPTESGGGMLPPSDDLPFGPSVV